MSEAAYSPRTLNERIDYWISIKNWSLVMRMHRFIYRISGGRMGGAKRGIPVLLLETTGRKSGVAHTVPLMYLDHNGSYVVVGSNAGLDRDPDWLMNLRDRPEVTVQIGDRQVRVIARESSGAESAELWPRLIAMNPFYQGYQERTARKTPVVVLEQSSNAASQPGQAGE